MTMQTTRRALLKAAPIAATAFAVPAAALTATTDRSRWEAALLAYRQVRAEEASFDARYLKAWPACDAEIARVPHVTFPPEAYTAGRCQTTSDAWEVTRARREVAALDAGKMRLDPVPGLREHYDIKRQLVRAADERGAAIQTIRDRYGMDELDDKSDQLGNAIAEAAERLMEMPAPDLAALRWKLEYLHEDEDRGMPAWSADFVRQTFQDVARLLPLGG